MSSKLANELHHIFKNAEQKRLKALAPRRRVNILVLSAVILLLKYQSLSAKLHPKLKSQTANNAAFNILSGKMVAAAATSTIKEGKMMESAMINFGVSLGVSGLGAAFKRNRYIRKINR
ncbi:hypothetical protein J4731_11120 [Providencia rettgeri]|nr:hypothetical protein [Providencia rettgeri]